MTRMRRMGGDFMTTDGSGNEGWGIEGGGRFCSCLQARSWKGLGELKHTPKLPSPAEGGWGLMA